jgi:hypothetical protein
VKIFVAAVEALRIKERQDEAQFILQCMQRHIYLTQFPPIQPPKLD